MTKVTVKAWVHAGPSISLAELANSCEKVFLMVDAAKHNGWTVTDSDVREHVEGCDDCKDAVSLTS
jgi:hypothetical protein